MDTTTMTILYAACVWVAWSLGTTIGVTHWDVYEGLIYDETVTELEAEVCQGTDAYTPFEVHVVGCDDEPRCTEESDQLVVQWEWDFDVTEDGVVGFADFGGFAAAFGSPPPNNGWDFDADGDGIVGFSDFGFFSQAFGKCNDGVKQVECGEVFP